MNIRISAVWVFVTVLILCAGARAADELYPIVQDGKWGYMDKAGKVVIAPQYDCAWDFSEGLACVQEGLLRGYIDPAGTMVIKPEYALARPFAEGLAAVCVGAQKWGAVMDIRGGGKWIFIDKTGKVAIDPPNTRLGIADDFHDGEARVKFVFNVHMRSSHIDRKGTIRPFRNKSVGIFSDGLAAYPDGKGIYGFIDHSANYVIPADYEDAGCFSDGLARVKKNKKWSFIDKTGKAAFAGEFDDARDFSEGMAAVQTGGKWGCIDKTGKTVIEPKYDFVGPLSEGLARVVLGGRHGYADAAGSAAVEPKFDVGWEFRKGLARVELDGKLGYIDKTGAFVRQPAK